MDQRFEEMDQRFEEMNQRFEKVDLKFERMDQKFEQKFKEVNEHLAEHDKKFEEMQRSLVLIEYEVTDKIPALFDGYSANNEHFEILKKRVDELESKENLNSIKISILEDKIG